MRIHNGTTIAIRKIINQDRTGMFADQPAFKPDAQTGNRIHEWCRDGEKVDLHYLIVACKNNQDLKTRYSQCYQDHRVSYQSLFNQKTFGREHVYKYLPLKNSIYKTRIIFAS